MSLNFEETLGIRMLTSEYIEDYISEIGSCYKSRKRRYRGYTYLGIPLPDDTGYM